MAATMYLDDLDNLLRGGAATLSAGLRERQRAYVLGLQRPDGGWAGRAGPSDPYYTDFALRILTLLGALPPARESSCDPQITECLARAAAYLRSAPAPNNVVECFSLLNLARMVTSMASMDSMASLLSRWLLPSGGFSRPGSPGASAYATFLAALSCEMLNQPFPEPGGAVAAIASLKRPGGGYADLGSAPSGQTSATTAAIAFLTMRGSITAPDPSVIDFLSSMQSLDGGFRAVADSAIHNPQSAIPSDLLSTFTALTTLFALDGLKRVDLKGAVSFVSSLALETGGFRAAADDSDSDLEYTYYGLGALALVRVYVALLKTFA